ncbi:hypothetical protein LTR27_003083 [Elasticomyces elasticus]|nr:hypothetical protein LTR27_003083 [Elasticomyces elasticus]
MSCDHESIEADLRNLTITLVDTLINTRDLESPFVATRLAPRMHTVGPQTGHTCRSRAELLKNIRATVQTNPGYRLDLSDDGVYVELDRVRGWGTVWLVAAVRGFLPGEEKGQLGREWVAKLDWRWRGSLGHGSVGDEELGQWVCIRLAGMTGSSGLLRGI